jgi:hypothetical protein
MVSIATEPASAPPRPAVRWGDSLRAALAAAALVLTAQLTGEPWSPAPSTTPPSTAESGTGAINCRWSGATGWGASGALSCFPRAIGLTHTGNGSFLPLRPCRLLSGGRQPSRFTTGVGLLPGTAIGGGSLVALAPMVQASLPHIAVHLVQAPGIRGKHAHRHGRARPAGVVPLGFAGQGVKRPVRWLRRHPAGARPWGDVRRRHPQLPIRCRLSRRRCGAARCSHRYTACQVPSSRRPPCTLRLRLVQVRAVRMWAGMSSGPSSSCE